MILEFDLGNTRCKWRLRNKIKIIASGHLPIGNPINELELSLGQYKNDIHVVWAVSVVGFELEDNLTVWCQNYLSVPPLFARASGFCAGVSNGYVEPGLLGADRWLGIISAYNRFRKPLIMVSFGTAITIDLVVQNGRHVGGFIAPGFNLMLDSLARGTRQVMVDRRFEEASLLPGVTTTTAVCAASAAMVVGLIENALAQLRNLESQVDIEIIFTGGDSGKLLSFYPGAQQALDLVLDGLAYVFSDPNGVER